jgi:hypothetical protein
MQRTLPAGSVSASGPRMADAALSDVQGVARRPVPDAVGARGIWAACGPAAPGASRAGGSPGCMGKDIAEIHRLLAELERLELSATVNRSWREG